MDRNFMLDYFRTKYEGKEIDIIMSGHKEYENLCEQISKKEENLLKVLKESQNEALYEIIASIVGAREALISEEMYLRGAQDREIMLR